MGGWDFAYRYRPWAGNARERPGGGARLPPVGGKCTGGWDFAYTKWLLPSYQGAPPTGGALLLSGGGAPQNRPVIPAGYPIYWYTGTADDATNSSDGYDAINDARQGALSYYTAGAQALMSTPEGIGHNTTRQAGHLLTNILN